MSQYYSANGSPSYQTINTSGYPPLINMLPYGHVMMPQPIQTFNSAMSNINQSASVQPLGSPVQPLGSPVQPLGSPVQPLGSPAQQCSPVIALQQSSPATSNQQNMVTFVPYNVSNQPSPPAINHSAVIPLPIQPILTVSASHPSISSAVIPLTPHIRATSTGHTTPVVESPAKEESVQMADDDNKTASDPVTYQNKKNDLKRQYLHGKEQLEFLEILSDELVSCLAEAQAKNVKLLAKKTALLRELMRFESKRISGGTVNVDMPETKHPTGKRARGFTRCLQPRANDGGLCYHPILTARAKVNVPCHGAEQHANHQPPSAKKRRTKSKD